MSHLLHMISRGAALLARPIPKPVAHSPGACFTGYMAAVTDYAEAIRALPDESAVVGPFPEFRDIDGASSPALIATRRIYRDREAKLKAALDNRDYEIKQLKAQIKAAT